MEGLGPNRGPHPPPPCIQGFNPTIICESTLSHLGTGVLFFLILALLAQNYPITSLLLFGWSFREP